MSQFFILVISKLTRHLFQIMSPNQNLCRGGIYDIKSVCDKQQSKIMYSRAKRKQKSTGRWQESVSYTRSGSWVIFSFCSVTHFCFDSFSARGRAKSKKNTQKNTQVRWVPVRGGFMKMGCGEKTQKMKTEKLQRKGDWQTDEKSEERQREESTQEQEILDL